MVRLLLFEVLTQLFQMLYQWLCVEVRMVVVGFLKQSYQ